MCGTSSFSFFLLLVYYIAATQFRFTVSFLIYLVNFNLLFRPSWARYFSLHTQRKVPKRNGARRLVRYANSLDSRFSWRSPKLASLRSLGQGFASSSKSCESRLRLTGIENLVNILINKHVLNKWIEGIKPPSGATRASPVFDPAPRAQGSARVFHRDRKSR